MNKRTGRLLTLAGFGLMTLLSVLLFFKYLLGITFPSAPIMNALNVLSWILVILGFAVLFLAERKIFDLLICAAFAISLIMRLVHNISWRFDILQLLSARTKLKVITIPALLILIALWTWAIRLLKKKPLAAVIIIISTVIPAVLPRLLFEIIPSSLITSAALSSTITSIVTSLLHTAGAYLDN